MVATKTGTVVQLLTGRVSAGVLERGGGAGEVALHGVLVGGLGAHVLVEEFADEAGDAHVSMGGFDAGPVGGPLVEGDRDVLHSTILVLHENRVKGARVARTQPALASCRRRWCVGGLPADRP